MVMESGGLGVRLSRASWQGGPFGGRSLAASGVPSRRAGLIGAALTRNLLALGPQQGWSRGGAAWLTRIRRPERVNLFGAGPGTGERRVQEVVRRQYTSTAGGSPEELSGSAYQAGVVEAVATSVRSAASPRPGPREGGRSGTRASRHGDQPEVEHLRSGSRIAPVRIGHQRPLTFRFKT